MTGTGTGTGTGGMTGTGTGTGTGSMTGTGTGSGTGSGAGHMIPTSGYEVFVTIDGGRVLFQLLAFFSITVPHCFISYLQFAYCFFSLIFASFFTNAKHLHILYVLYMYINILQENVCQNVHQV